MSRKIGLIFLISLLLLSTVAVASTAFITPVSAAGKSAWLKIVTSAWKGTSCGIYDGIGTGFANDGPNVNTPMCPGGSGFADRFNVTGQEAFVEVYSIKPNFEFEQLEGTFEPNATGFVKISWDAPDDWGLLILVKAKSYYGTKIGAGDPFSGIIMYALLIPPRNATGPALSDSVVTKIAELTGVSSDTNPEENYLKWNFTVNDDGLIDVHGNRGTEGPEDYFNFDLPRAGLGSGPFDYLNGTSVDLGSFATIFGNETAEGYPVNAWVARAAKLFKVFHVHSWYDVKDNLSFAQVKIYDLDHTDPTSEASLIQACVTAEDGQCRYTREIYPVEEGQTGGKFQDNNLVPIPLQIFNLENQTIYHGGIEDPATLGGAIGAPKLNATVRVWWETVIVNQTIYYGYEYNGSTYIDHSGSPDYLDKNEIAFVGPLSMAMNNTVTVDTTRSGIAWAGGTKTNVANFINATVFYAQFCTFDNDAAIWFPNASAHYASMDLNGDGEAEDVTGNQLIGALVAINLKTTNNESYYMTKNLLSTNETGCTDDPHKYRGGLDEYKWFARFPNATMGDWVWKGKDVWIGSFRDKFGDYVWLNVSLMYNPADADNKEDIPEGPNLEDVANPTRIGDEDVAENEYFNGNWSMLVADVSYANTLTLTDDKEKEYDGFDVLVSWKGGWQNVYPGNEELVAELHVKDPFAIAYNITNRWIKPHDFSEVVDWDAPIAVLDNVTADGTRGRVNMTTYVYDIVFYVVDALGNPLPAAETEVDLRLPNGNFYAKIPSIDESLTTGVYWSYYHFGEGNVTFFQLPGNKGPYGIRVIYQGVEVYYKIDEIDVLTETTVVTIRTPVYKVKLVFYDCKGENVIPQLWVKYTMPDGRSDWRQTSEHGELEFPYIPGGVLTISRVWWKGIEVPLFAAEEADGTDIPLTEENELKLDITSGIDMPVKVMVPIKTLIFYTTNFQGDYKIPRLNITLTWVGTYKPWTDEKVYFLETLDPTGDTVDVDGDGNTRNDYNTSVTIHDLWFRYRIDTFFHKIADDSPMEGLAEWEAKYVFYEMPPTIYNITVTTVTDTDAYGSNPVNGMKGVTPGTSKWPGTGKDVPYEIKIHWSWATSYEDSMPEIVTGTDINDRVVLRIFGSMGGVPVTPENFPDTWEAWNPDLIGDRTALVCEEEITLKTWAHDFWKRVIDGEYRVGDAEFKVFNDNGIEMPFYDITEEKWSTRVSKWTEDIKDISAIMRDSHYTSTIYWNGSYKLTDMYFETNKTYSYSKKENASFIVDKFYNASAPNDVADYLNFTLVGTEKLWKTDRRFDIWVDRIEGNTYKDWYPAWFVVYELPSPEDEYKVEASEVDGKGVLPIPIPVAFIKLGAFGKDGAANPLNNALIELWIVHILDNCKVKISAADEGNDTTGCYYGEMYRVDVEWKWEKKRVETEVPQIFEETRWDRVWLTIRLKNAKNGKYDYNKTLYLQVPPSPAKLILRNVVADLDLAVSRNYVYVLQSNPAYDWNVGVEDKWGSVDGLLAYGRWYTDEDGYVNSFKDLGPDDPRYGTVVLPISGWLNASYDDGKEGTEDEFHYQINVVWESAVVYSDNVVLDKTGYEIGPTEVYNPTFYMALCNGTTTVVKGLYVTIWYPNVTTWHENKLWYTVPDKPEDLESTEDLPVYVSANELWAEGKKSFELIPGPRFMNTTWKYTFLANHTEIDWLDNLVHTALVLNNETFGDGALRTASPTKDIDVPIMLAAAKQVLFEVLTWRDEAGIATAYPIPGYTVKYVIRETGGGFVAAEGEAVTDAEGKVVLSSGDTVDKVFWVGMTIRYRVEPPEKFKDMTHAYYPDEEPSHWAIASIDTWFTSVPEGLLCNGLCTYSKLYQRSKPYVVEVDYTAVTARVTDYNGRPVVGALVQLWDKASGKLAAYSKTVDYTWEAKPVNMTGFWATHGLDIATGEVKIPFQEKARVFGGMGFTKLMNVTVGPVAFDVNNDDDTDDAGERIPYRGVPPGEADGENPSYTTYIVRVFWTPPGTVKDGALYPHPEIKGRTAKVYDSEEDETTWKLLLPRHIAYWPEKERSLRVYEIRSDEAPTGALVKEHKDAHAAIFDVKAKFVYDVNKEPPKLDITFSGQGVSISAKDTSIEVVGLVRGTYTIEAKFKGELVARTPIDLSNVNVGTVTRSIPVALTDVSFRAVDMLGRVLKDATVSVTPDIYAEKPSNLGGIITIRAMVTTKLYTFKISWASPVYGTEASVTIADTPEGLKARKVIELPVGTVTVSVVDTKGRPISGAEVTFGKVTKKTDAAGKAYFEGVPLEKEGAGISYDVTVKREGFVVFSGTETVSRARTTITEIGELFTIRVRVVGAAGQGLPFAKVVIKRAGAEIGTYTTDEGGFLEIKEMPFSDYTVEAEWKGFRGSATISKDDLKAGRAVEISLPPYTEIAGVPLTFGALLALIIGLVILVIVIVILLSEYIRWRGRRLGIYPPPPPKK